MPVTRISPTAHIAAIWSDHTVITQGSHRSLEAANEGLCALIGVVKVSSVRCVWVGIRPVSTGLWWFIAHEWYSPTPQDACGLGVTVGSALFDVKKAKSYSALLYN